jgi:hypothetical protein
VIRTLTGPFIQRRKRDPYKTLDPLNADDIASVSIASFDAAIEHRWSWPLRFGMQPTNVRIGDMVAKTRAAQRGFLDLVVPQSTLDVGFMARPSISELRTAIARQAGITLIQTDLSAANRARNEVLGVGLSPDLIAPIAFVDIAKIPDFINAFTYEVAHNKSLDQALFDAYTLT